jgi:hypothetical protein
MEISVEDECHRDELAEQVLNLRIAHHADRLTYLLSTVLSM